MAWSGEGRDWAAAASAAEGGARLRAGGRAGRRRARRSKSASQTLQQSPELGRRRRRRRRRRRGGGGRGGGTTRPRARPRARPWPRGGRCARQRCRSQGRARRGAEGGRGGGAPSRSELAGAPALGAAAASGEWRPRPGGSDERPPPPEMAGSAARGGVGLALAGRASGGVGAAGGPRCGAAGADADGGVSSAEGDGFRANPASPAGSEPARELGGPGQRGRQVVELARGLTGAFLAVLGRGREGGRRVAPDPGRGRAPARLSSSARSPGRFSSRRSQSCCPGRPGRRRAQLPPPLARVPPCSELAGSRTGESG